MVVTAGLWWAYFGEADDELREAGFVAAVAGQPDRKRQSDQTT